MVPGSTPVLPPNTDEVEAVPPEEVETPSGSGNSRLVSNRLSRQSDVGNSVTHLLIVFYFVLFVREYLTEPITTVLYIPSIIYIHHHHYTSFYPTHKY